MSRTVRAMSIAWEQCEHWSSYMSAAEACRAVEIEQTNWAGVARRLALLWLELDDLKSVRKAA